MKVLDTGTSSQHAWAERRCYSVALAFKWVVKKFNISTFVFSFSNSEMSGAMSGTEPCIVSGTVCLVISEILILSEYRKCYGFGLKHSIMDSHRENYPCSEALLSIDRYEAQTSPLLLSKQS